jgi:hypothetical protein
MLPILNHTRKIHFQTQVSKSYIQFFLMAVIIIIISSSSSSSSLKA